MVSNEHWAKDVVGKEKGWGWWQRTTYHCDSENQCKNAIIQILKSDYYYLGLGKSE